MLKFRSETGTQVCFENYNGNMADVAKGSSYNLSREETLKFITSANKSADDDRGRGVILKFLLVGS